MALPDLALPYGLRDVKIKPIDPADGSLGTAIDLPAARTFNFTEAEDFETLEGDDGVVAIRGKGAVINWSLESGGISLEAFAAMSGGTLSETGTTPNIKRTVKKSAQDARPYFQVEGQVISDSGGDVHGVVHKAKVSGDIGGEFGNGAFFLTSASGQGINNVDGDLYEITQNESETSIT